MDKALTSKQRQQIISALRRIWRNSENCKATRARCAVDKKTSKCEKCGDVIHKKLLELDHITPIGGIVRGCNGDWNLYIERLFFGDLQGLCENCHRVKTNSREDLSFLE